MGRLTVVFIPEGANATRQFTIPKVLVKALGGSIFVFTCFFGYLAFDYLQLREMRASYFNMIAENEGLKGEARLLMDNLDDVKRSLNQVQDYSAKLSDITQIKVKSVSKKTGIGPLSPEEYSLATNNGAAAAAADDIEEDAPANIPLGINMDKLVFQPVFDRLSDLGRRSNHSALELQKLLSNLSQQKSLLLSIPSISPVNGWITSSFGSRVSPFTGKRALHRGLDVASPIGTPIYAPADGVVIFIGAKEGFGNFIMVAHGYGVVTRYGHNSENMVQIGQKVSRGDQIATVGSSGRSTGPHLHYEVLVNGNYVDPRKFILDMPN